MEPTQPGAQGGYEAGVWPVSGWAHLAHGAGPQSVTVSLRPRLRASTGDGGPGTVVLLGAPGLQSWPETSPCCAITFPGAMMCDMTEIRILVVVLGLVGTWCWAGGR